VDDGQEGIGRYEGNWAGIGVPPRDPRVTSCGIGNETEASCIFRGLFHFVLSEGVLTLFCRRQQLAALITNSLSQNPAPDDRKPELYPKGVKLPATWKFRCQPIPHPELSGFSTFEVNLHTGELRSGTEGKAPGAAIAGVGGAAGTAWGIGYPRGDTRPKLLPADTFVDFDHSLNAAIKEVARMRWANRRRRPFFVRDGRPTRNRF